MEESMVVEIDCTTGVETIRPMTTEELAMRQQMLDAEIARNEGCDVVIGLVGRINEHKGHSLLLQALERLHRAGEHRPRLVFAGDAAAGAEAVWQALAARIAASPLADRVAMLGFVATFAIAHAQVMWVYLTELSHNPYGGLGMSVAGS